VTALLDFAECDRARLARDPAYDGRFFTGVRTTGVYCRPVCPERPARSANVDYYPSAAAAEAAGFRPCLRCRPETAPFCPAWKGSRTTVERALRLIEEGALDGEGCSVDGLAERVGIGAPPGAALRQAHPSKPVASRQDHSCATRQTSARHHRPPGGGNRTASRLRQPATPYSPRSMAGRRPRSAGADRTPGRATLIFRQKPHNWSSGKSQLHGVQCNHDRNCLTL
jgi:hypothetical protein